MLASSITSTPPRGSPWPVSTAGLAAATVTDRMPAPS
jgi:hypothetical protein